MYDDGNWPRTAITGRELAGDPGGQHASTGPYWRGVVPSGHTWPKTARVVQCCGMCPGP